jgi:hypothetical protein
MFFTHSLESNNNNNNKKTKENSFTNEKKKEYAVSLCMGFIIWLHGKQT